MGKEENETDRDKNDSVEPQEKINELRLLFIQAAEEILQQNALRARQDFVDSVNFWYSGAIEIITNGRITDFEDLSNMSRSKLDDEALFLRLVSDFPEPLKSMLISGQIKTALLDENSNQH